MFSRPCACLFFALLMVAPAIGQTQSTQSSPPPDASQTTGPESAEKQNQDQKAQLEKSGLDLLNQVIVEIGGLKLPENRILLQASAAQLLWKLDQNRARALFQQAAGALAALIHALDPNDPDYNAQFQSTMQLRQELMEVAGPLDPAMAMDFLAATKLPLPAGVSYGNQNPETNLKLELASQIAASDPGSALQIAEGTRKDGPSAALINVLSGMQSADMNSAQKLAGELAGDLQAQDLSANPETANVALSLLSMALSSGEASGQPPSDQSSQAQPAALLDPQAVKSLLSQIVSSTSQASSSQANGAMEVLQIHDSRGNVFIGNSASILFQLKNLLPTIQQFDSRQAAIISQRVAALNQGNTSVPAYDLPATATVDDILAAASTASPDFRAGLYIQALYKAAADGDLDRARQIANDHVTDPSSRQQLLDQIDQQAAAKASEEDKLEAAWKAAVRIRGKETRVSALMQLATTAIDKSETKLGLLILNDAQTQLSSRAENYNQLNLEFGIAGLYSKITPERTVEVFRAPIEQLNSLISAASVLNGFEVQGAFSSGEMVVSTNGGASLVNALQVLADQLASIAQKDSVRAVEATAAIQTPEAALFVRFHIARGLLSGSTPGLSTSASSRPHLVSSGFSID
jgi:hypothetical protein